MQLASITIFSNKLQPVFGDGWMFQNGMLEILLPTQTISGRNKYAYTDRINIPSKSSSGTLIYDGFLFTVDGATGRTGTVFTDQKDNDKKICLLIIFDGKVDIPRGREDVRVKMARKIRGSENCMLVVNYEKEKGLVFTIKKDKDEKKIKVGWDKKNKQPTVKEVKPSALDVIRDVVVNYLRGER